MNILKNVVLVVVTFNRSHLLTELIDSLFGSTCFPNEVLIIDNNSSDNTKNVIDSFVKKSDGLFAVNYHNTGENLGGAGGFEFGCRLAHSMGYEWIWLLDDDVELDSQCLEHLFYCDSNAAIKQPFRVNMDGTCAEYSGVDYEINNLFRLNPKKITVLDIAHENWDLHKIKTIPFEGPLIHRDVFNKIGFPDPRFFIFYDDLDFAMRAQKAGFGLVCVKNSILKRKLYFFQNHALNSWKGYFMYRNFFYVQLTYGQKLIAQLRVILIFILVSIYSIITCRFKYIPVLFSALMDAEKSNFTENAKHLPN